MIACDPLIECVRKSGLISEDDLDKHLQARAGRTGEDLLRGLVEAGLLTRFQAGLLAEGKHLGFFLGPYKVLRPIGRGGMGVVYLAEHTRLKRRAAVKVLASSRAQEDGAVERFHREARAAAALTHPNIVRVLDVGTEGRCHYLAMEYVEGMTLEEAVSRRGWLPWHEAAAVGAQAALGLAHAHQRGLIHRDIKPSNLLQTRNGVIKLLDLGLARFADEERNGHLTERLGGRAIIGTPDFISPEQVTGKADTRSDIYCLGATLYALIVGRPPFPYGDARDKYLAHQCQDPMPLAECVPGIPQGLSDVVARMMAKPPLRRPQSAEEALRLLEPWARPGRRDPAPRPGWVRRLWAWLTGRFGR
jgi:serine/threonine protein kinase